MVRRSAWVAAWLVPIACLVPEPAVADVDARVLAREFAPEVLPRAFVASDGRIPLLIELPAGTRAADYGLSEAAPGFASARLSPKETAQLVTTRPELRPWWAPPRRPLLNSAENWTRAALFRNQTGLSGKGVIVGIIDTGYDPRHPDLLDDDGRTRARWVIDFSKAPAGLHPELEAEYGCTSDGAPCAVFSGSDVDALIGSGSSQAPRDPYGHGTHVASLAAGDGSSTESPKLVGSAPEATLVIARVTRNDSGAIFDADILTAARFVFDRAAELDMPAVANLSLGSDFGAHDGSSALERGLATLVGPGHPGRALVVAAGNSAGVYPDMVGGYPSPLGIHTEVHVPRSSDVRVPLLSPPLPNSAPSTSGTIYVWIATRPGDALEVGLDDAGGEWIEPLPPGHGAAYDKGDLEATIINDVRAPDSAIPESSQGVVVTLDGSWKSGTTFALRFRGHGTARIWVQAEGDLAAGLGPLLPRASKEGTIGIPASSPSLIAVGATINRLGWKSRSGNEIRVGEFGSVDKPQLDSSAYFSGAGPTSDGRMKPDIVAPGVFLIGAMSSLADPQLVGNNGIFGGSTICEDDPGCLVVDDFHAVSSGTSMAAPIVSGAIALLFERSPALTQPEIRTLLQAGARRLEGTVPVEQQAGPGALDLIGTLQVLDAAEHGSTAEPDAAQSWIALASSYAHPDPSWPLQGVVQLRTVEESIAEVDPSRLRLAVSTGTVTQPFERVAAGMWQFAVAAPSGSGLGTLTLSVLLDGEPLLTRSVPIATDRWIAEHGVEARGGCGVGRAGRADFAGVLALVAIALGRRRRRR